jgi:hypothetical protein
MMKRILRKKLFTPTLIAFATSLFIVPAASAMPMLNDPGDTSSPAFVNYGPYDGYITRTASKPIVSPLAKPAFVNYGPYDGYVTRTAHGPVTSPDLQPLTDGWYSAVVKSPAATPTVVTPASGDFPTRDVGIGLALGLLLTGILATAVVRNRRDQHIPALR